MSAVFSCYNNKSFKFHTITSRTTSSVERPSVNFVVRSLRHFSVKKKKALDCLQPPLSKMVYDGPAYISALDRGSLIWEITSVFIL